MIDYDYNKRYFKQNAAAGRKYKKVCFALICCLVVGFYNGVFNKSGPLLLLGILSAAILVIMFIIRRRHSLFRPGHEKIDAQIQELKSKQRQRAMKFLCLEEEELAAQPFLLHGYNFWGNYSQSYGNDGFGDVKGKDGDWRSPEFEMDTWLFTEDQILLHRKTVSLVWSGCDSEKTKTFFYRDIASVRKEATSSSTKFIVTNYAGETLVCNCVDDELVEQAVVALQSLIKEKKG